MNDNQAALFDLLCEFDDICEKNNITYYLHADLAMVALKGGCFEGERLQSGVQMTAGEALKFIRVVEAANPSNRTVEHMANSEGMPTINFRYVNTATMYLPFNYWGNYRARGLAINVFIIRSPIRKPLRRAVLYRLENGVEAESRYLPRALSPAEQRWKRTVTILQKAVGKERFRKWLFFRMLREYRYRGSGSTWVRVHNGVRRDYPEDYLAMKPAMVALEGREFPVFRLTGSFVKKWYGRNWRNRESGALPGKSLMVDSQIGYAEFEAYIEKTGHSLEAAGAQHRTMRSDILDRQEYNVLRKGLMGIARNVKSNFDAQEHYELQELRFARWRENGCIMEIDSGLGRYRKLMKANEKYGNDALFAPAYTAAMQAEIDALKQGEPLTEDPEYLKADKRFYLSDSDGM